MELPENLKTLYRHWPLHVSGTRKSTGSNNIFEDKKLYKEISDFVHERINIWHKKTSGKASPYTSNPILSTYRFCNIFREFDKQTMEFHALLNPLRDNFSLWLLNMFYCRMVARSETIMKTGLLSFDTKKNEAVYKKLLALPRPRYGNAYIFPVSIIMKSSTPTRELFITKHLPKVMRSVAKEIKSWKKLSVYAGVERILPIFGFNLRFLWTEVLIDMAYQYPEYLDLFGEFPIGPGALPTQKRVKASVKDLSRINFNTGITYKNKPLRLSAENWEWIFCEFRKYTNLKTGRGRKRIYKKS
jgi:hypothetical protein